MITLHLSDSVIRSLSDNELALLKYVHDHGEDILQMSIQEFSRRVSYSSATILRFCKKLGYSGYAELKYVLRSALREAEGNQPSQNQDGENAVTWELVQSTLGTIVEGTSKLLSEELLIRTFQFFDSDRPIYIWEPGGMTSIPARYLEKLLLAVGRQKTYLLEASRVAEHVLRTSGSDAVLVLISTSGAYGPTLRLGKIANLNHIPVISISPYTSNELAKLSTISFRFFAPQRENLGADVTPRLPIFYIINMIIQCYLQYRNTLSSGGAQ